MRVVVPFAAHAPKTRLESVLTAPERGAFARVMLEHVCDAVTESGYEPEVLATGAVDVDAPVTVDERPLTDAVNGVLGETLSEPDPEPVAVVMADLALVTPAALEGLFAAGGPGGQASDGVSTDGAVVLAPGRGGGTNAVLTPHPDFRVDYHGISVRDHREAAAAVGASVRSVDSHRLATDVDEPTDLVEVLLHGRGGPRDWLVDAGFELAVDGGRVDVHRDGED
jgi:2-phospho-L-lactate guanylyltransferase